MLTVELGYSYIAVSLPKDWTKTRSMLIGVYIFNKSVSEQVFCLGSSVEHTLRVISETLHKVFTAFFFPLMYRFS